jgi:multidrug efflux pump subunit AcrA (membrane-fusion protein)
MQTKSIGTPAEPDMGRGGAPRYIAVVVPLIVLASFVGLLGFAAWPVIQPARKVTVGQAVFDRDLEIAPASQDTPAARMRSVPTVQAPGWLEPEPYFIAATALADGVVETIEALEGDYVEAGDVLATLVAQDSELRLSAAEAQLASAQAAVAAARAELAAAQTAWDEPVALERAVQAGTAALAESEAELAQLPSLIRAARATLVRLDEEATRVRRSTEQGATNELELIIAEQSAEAQRAQVAALEARTPVLQARVDRLQADLAAARRDLELRVADRRRLDVATAELASTQASLARAQIERSEAALEHERMTVRAPISGFVQRRLKLPGDKAIRMMDSPHSAHIMHLYDPDHMQVRVDVPLADASHISVGQSAEVVVEVLPDRTFAGEVLRITHEADLQKNTLEVKVRVLDPDPALRPEMLTRVKFLPPGGEPGADASRTGGASGGARSNARVLVPADAVHDNAGSPTVWLVTDRRNDRGTLSPAPVRVLGETEAGWLAVSGDIRAGALVALGLTDPVPGETVVVSKRSSGVASRSGSNEGGPRS